MTTHSFLGRRLAITLLTVAGVLAASAAPATADTTPPGDASYSQSGSSAELYASDCSTDGDATSCTEQQISAFVGRMSDSVSGVTHVSQLCVAVSHYTYSESGGEFIGFPSFERGCLVDLPAGAIRIDTKLRTATLASTTVRVQDEACEKFGCDPGVGRDIVATAAWSGFGSLQSSKSHGGSDDGTCRSHEFFKGSTRLAAVTGSLDGTAIFGDFFGALSSGKYTYRSSCVEI